MKKTLLTLILCALCAVILPACGFFESKPVQQIENGETVKTVNVTENTESTAAAEQNTTEPAKPAAVNLEEMYSKLVGTWEFIGGEMDGSAVTADEMTCTLTFNADGTADYHEVMAFYEEESYDDIGMRTEMRREPVYAGCGNEDWSVKVYTSAEGKVFYASILPDGTMVFRQETHFDGEETTSIFSATYKRA